MFKKLAAAAALTVLLAMPASAQPVGSFGHHGMHGQPFLMMLKSANLTAAQQGQVRLILTSNRTQMMSQMRELQNLHEQISAKLLSPGQVTSADLKPLVDRASRIQASVNQSKAETALSIRNLLTPQQVAKLAELHGKLRNLHNQVQHLMGPAPEEDDN